MKSGGQKRPAEYGRILLLSAAALLLIFGALRSEMQEVWQKAAAVCLECCGIG